MIAYLQGISQLRSSWKLLLVSALFLELSAMVFQHGLGLSPCVMCIYERIATMGLITAALVTTRFMGPWFFAVYADCAERQWSFLGWKLPQWLVPTFALYLTIWLLLLIANLAQKGHFRTCAE
ncbi:disulfide bond formation protein B [Prodigiosinella aquatilis]|nr:disulfide bond formation protein B [Prodigiosinella sp. LS101]WJV52443.1 disulfide bond formation protein B [Prodigiosinella sp. LS101]WJV56797.1 disulfide bond formation protein B [Pectobacteriaceae bacterium C111]